MFKGIGGASGNNDITVWNTIKHTQECRGGVVGRGDISPWHTFINTYPKSNSVQCKPKHSTVNIYWAGSCKLLFLPGFVRGTSGTKDLFALDMVVRRPRVFKLRCSRERASCFLRRSCSMREWWSFILCKECLRECETCLQMAALSVLLRR